MVISMEWQTVMVADRCYLWRWIKQITIAGHWTQSSIKYQFVAIECCHSFGFIWFRYVNPIQKDINTKNKQNSYWILKFRHVKNTSKSIARTSGTTALLSNVLSSVQTGNVLFRWENSKNFLRTKVSKLSMRFWYRSPQRCYSHYSYELFWRMRN